MESLRDRIIVNDKVAHIPGLEELVEQIIKMRLPTLHQVGDELMRGVKASFVLPAEDEGSYRIALLDYYDRRVTTFI